MATALILLPVLVGLAIFAVKHTILRRGLWIGASLTHCVLTFVCWLKRQPVNIDSWVGIDSIGLLFLTVISVLFLCVSIYGTGYLKASQHTIDTTELDETRFVKPARESIFIGCQLLFLSSMTLVLLSQHYGLLWVAIEATTLASAPLIYYHKTKTSLEATWKYLLICSVGIALALLGTFFLGISAAKIASDSPVPLTISALAKYGNQLQTQWLKLAFVFIFVGYGVKMGLAPLHTWLPDAHSEAPSVVSALLSGALLNCAFIGILRLLQVCSSAGCIEFARNFLILFGVLSIVIATAFIVGQGDYKRLLAYSSVEHMGLLALGAGLGGTAAFGSFFHLINHSFTKGALFLASGILLEAYQTKKIDQIRGVLRSLPLTGVLWVGGLFAITGTPPFGTFFSELIILTGAFGYGAGWIAAIVLLALAIAFAAMAKAFLQMAQGQASELKITLNKNQLLLMIVPVVVLAILTLSLGVYVPVPLYNLLKEATSAIGGI